MCCWAGGAHVDAVCGCRCRVRRRVGLLFFFQAEDGIRDLVRSRGLGDVYKRQVTKLVADVVLEHATFAEFPEMIAEGRAAIRTVLSLSLIHI